MTLRVQIAGINSVLSRVPRNRTTAPPEDKDHDEDNPSGSTYSGLHDVVQLILQRDAISYRIIRFASVKLQEMTPALWHLETLSFGCAGPSMFSHGSVRFPDASCRATNKTPCPKRTQCWRKLVRRVERQRNRVPFNKDDPVGSFASAGKSRSPHHPATPALRTILTVSAQRIVAFGRPRPSTKHVSVALSENLSCPSCMAVSRETGW